MLNLGPDIEKLSADVFKSCMLTFLEPYYSKRGLKERTQCGNFMISLSFRFYVKSILEILEVQHLPFFEILRVLNFVNLVDFSLEKVQKFIKMQFYNLLK